MNKLTILHGDNRLRLKDFPANCFDSCVCDPPYELGFMGKKWDSSGISYDVEMWGEVFRVLKPGAHLLAFGGSRTYHRLACAIEDAGFIIRDQIMWLYGSGFPKNHDVSKAMDKAAGVAREVVGKKGGRCGEPKQDIRGGNLMSGTRDRIDCSDLTAPATDAARQWDGWGTALKPAHEPIVVARKPLEGTVVRNVLKYGTGAINVAGCRIDLEEDCRLLKGGTYGGNRKSGAGTSIFGCGGKEVLYGEVPAGRWPTNVIHDGSDEVLACFPDSKGQQGDVRGTEASRTGGEGTACYGEYGRVPAGKRGDNGSAARFFYCAKASPAERNLGCEGLSLHESRYGKNFSSSDKGSISGSKLPTRNNHPTVKPLALMAYLVRLVTPPGVVVLDPFMGSGTTLIAAAKEGFDAVGIDLEAENCELSERRIRGHHGMLVEITYAP